MTVTDHRTHKHPRHTDFAASGDHCPIPVGDGERCEAVSVNMVGRTDTQLGVTSEHHTCEAGHIWDRRWMTPSWGQA